MQTRLMNFATKLATIMDGVHIDHYWHPVKDAPYLIWFENGENEYFSADNKKAEMVLNISIEYFTKVEFDTLVDDLQEFLNGIGPWTLDSVLYENDTNLIHYSWSLVMVV